MEFRLLTEEEEAKLREEDSKLERIGTTTPDGKWVMGCPDCYYANIRSFGPTGCKTCNDERSVVVDPIETRPLCKSEDHVWIIEFEAGFYNLRCKDPHTPIECEAMRRHDPDLYPVTGCEYDEIHDLLAGDIEVRLRGVDDSIPAGPWGDAEFGYYYEIAEVISGTN